MRRIEPARSAVDQARLVLFEYRWEMRHGRGHHAKGRRGSGSRAR